MSQQLLGGEYSKRAGAWSLDFMRLSRIGNGDLQYIQARPYEAMRAAIPNSIRVPRPTAAVTAVATAQILVYTTQFNAIRPTTTLGSESSNTSLTERAVTRNEVLLRDRE